VIVILARHGETVGNSRGLILGQKDYPLTPSGIAVTKKLAGVIARRYLKTAIEDDSGSSMRQPPGIIFTSPLGRAKSSAGIFAEKTCRPIVILDGMAELACGEWEGRIRKVVVPDRPTIRATWTDFPPSGESYLNATARVKTAIDKIKALRGVDPVIIVGHGSVNRLFLKIWLDLEPAHAMTINQHHDRAYVLGEDKRAYWINADGKTGQGLDAE